jgi:hypothetical protein
MGVDSDATEDVTSRRIQIENEVYKVEAGSFWIDPENDKGHDLHSLQMFQFATRVIILCFDFASSESLQGLSRIFDNIPLPQEHPLKEGDVTVTATRKPLANRRITVELAHHGAASNSTVRADRFPILIVGCSGWQEKCGRSDVKEIQQADIELFVESHPGCTYAGECDTRNKDEVDAIFLQAIEVVRKLRLQAAQPETARELPLSPVTDRSRGSSQRKCWLSRIFRRS